MQNRKLFKAIQKLVEEKSYQIKTIKQKSNCILDYCNQQLLKKKLIPKDPKVKINQLMKNFQQLQTFVNVDELINCLNQICKGEESADSSIPSNHANEKIEKHKRYDSEGNQGVNSIKLRKFYKERNIRETQKMKHIMKELQRTSSAQKQRLKNNSKDPLFSMYDKIQKEGQKQAKQAKQARIDGNKNQILWNQYNHQKQIHSDKKIIEEKEILKSQRKTKNYDLELKKYKLFQLAGTYLQIALERHHRKKWKYLKKTHHHHNSQLPSNVTKFAIKKHNKTKGEHSMISNSILQRRSLIKDPKKIRWPKTNNKELALKQVTTFINNLDDNQIILKTQKKKEIKELDSFEKAINSEFPKYRINNFVTEKDLDEIKVMVENQK